ncbi:MAG: hypothetical protein RLY14_3199, partial [Planctomycetota bacterium]
MEKSTTSNENVPNKSQTSNRSAIEAEINALPAPVSSGWHWLESNIKLVTALAVIVLLGAASYLGMQFLSKRQ